MLTDAPSSLLPTDSSLAALDRAIEGCRVHPDLTNASREWWLNLLLDKRNRITG